MKTITTLSTLIMIALSLNTLADDKLKTSVKDEFSTVATSPFIWGSPEVDAPLGLGFVKAKNALVPIAPFEWGNNEEIVEIEERLLVPVAPFVFGNPSKDAPEIIEIVD